jgi:hypothetical protein
MYERGCTEKHMCRTLRVTKQTLYEQAALMGLIYGSGVGKNTKKAKKEVVLPKKPPIPLKKKAEYLPPDRNEYRAAGELKHKDGRKVFYG